MAGQVKFIIATETDQLKCVRSFFLIIYSNKFLEQFFRIFLFLLVLTNILVPRQNRKRGRQQSVAFLVVVVVVGVRWFVEKRKQNENLF